MTSYLEYEKISSVYYKKLKRSHLFGYAIVELRSFWETKDETMSDLTHHELAMSDFNNCEIITWRYRKPINSGK